MSGGKPKVAYTVNHTINIPSNRLILVVGVARGGTSMCAGVLSDLGIPMGDTYDDHQSQGYNIREERTVLDELMKGSDCNLDVVSETIARYQSQNPVFALKSPWLFSHYQKLRPGLCNPRIIAVFRDTVAISGRWEDKFGIRDTRLQDVWEMQCKLHHMVKTCSDPMLLVSYERALRNPAELVRSIAEFSGITSEPTSDSVQRAIKEVKNCGGC